MLCRMEVLRCMLVLGAVAAPHMPAFQAQTKMYPAVAGLHAFFAAGRMRLHRPYLIEVCAFRHALTILHLGENTSAAEVQQASLGARAVMSAPWNLILPHALEIENINLSIVVNMGTDLGQFRESLLHSLCNLNL